LYAVEDVRPGMKGVARTVFAGTEPEEFELEILGVLDGFTGPRQSTIIARLSGPNVARTGVFAGMSGSPVFIDNKLVGAIAYSFPFAKEPICGITPIKQMIDIFERAKEAPRTTEARAVSFSSLAGVDWMESLEPDFHSSIYGLLFIGFALLNGVAFAVGSGVLLRRHFGQLNGYSALLLSTILLWGYLHAMQYIVIWSGNIPAEVTWYLKRSTNGWQFVLIVLALGQLVFPFSALLSERVRRNQRWLVALCGLTLGMRICEAAILIMPPLARLSPLTASIMVPASLAFIGTALCWVFESAYKNAGDPLSFAAQRVRAET
jgi:hypothetical protein